jgi:N-acetylglucosaminyl-diphospho-decaprenol L-rhamnosyltransferase
MKISKKNLSVLIVTFRSSKIIERCIKSISKDIDIVIIDNSNDYFLKKKIEKKYSNVRFFLSNKNLGMGAGNNLGFRFIKKNYVFIINPDVVLKKNTINELINSSNLIDNFSILSPIVKV